MSVRQIAAEAGVNHALVHRYFGTKDEMVAAILLAEGEAMSALGRPGRRRRAPRWRRCARSFSTPWPDGRTSLLLMLRAEIDGLAPERMLDGAPLRPLALLQALARTRTLPRASSIDTQALAMVVGAAMMGLASCQPMLAAGVGRAGRG